MWKFIYVIIHSGWSLLLTSRPICYDILDSHSLQSWFILIFFQNQIKLEQALELERMGQRHADLTAIIQVGSAW